MSVLHAWVWLLLREESTALRTASLLHKLRLATHVRREVDVEVRSEIPEHVREAVQLGQVRQTFSSVTAMVGALHLNRLPVQIEAEGGLCLGLGCLLVHHRLLLLLCELFKIRMPMLVLTSGVALIGRIL